MKKKILVIVNTLTSISNFVYANHIRFFVEAKQAFPDWQFIFMTPHRAGIDLARNAAAVHALTLECDYLMFIDDDVLVPPDTLKRLVDDDKDIVAGLVIIRGYPFNVMAFKEKITEKDGKANKSLTYYNDLPKEHKKHILDDESICKDCNKEDFQVLQKMVSCAAVGFSCCLIKVDILRLLQEPYFITLPGMTEDVYFCTRVTEELTPTPEIFIDTHVQCGHLMSPEAIEWQYKEKFQNFYFEFNLNPVKEDQKDLTQKKFSK